MSKAVCFCNMNVLKRDIFYTYYGLKPQLFRVATFEE